MNTIVVGDPHGCLLELKKLLEDVEFKQGVDRLVIAGDLTDRGPDSPGTVRFLREIGAECVMGNHDEKVVRWARHESNRKPGGKKNPVQVYPKREAEWRQLSQEDLKWMAGFPIFMRLEPGYLVAHAGFEASRPPEEQSLDRVCRIQYVDLDTGDYKSGKTPREVPLHSERWMAAWPGPETVVYGHHVHSKVSPRIDVSRAGARCIGIDTGCVFGGMLTALVLDSSRDRSRSDDGVRFVSVKAFQTYFEDKSRGQPGED